MMRCGRACRGHLFRESLVVLCVRVNLRLFACSSMLQQQTLFLWLFHLMRATSSIITFSGGLAAPDLSLSLSL